MRFVVENKCRGPDSNRHVGSPTRDFKSLASTNSATPARFYGSYQAASLSFVSKYRLFPVLSQAKNTCILNNRINKIKKIPTTGIPYSLMPRFFRAGVWSHRLIWGGHTELLYRDSPKIIFHGSINFSWWKRKTFSFLANAFILFVKPLFEKRQKYSSVNVNFYFTIIIKNILQKTKGNKNEAAKILGVRRNTLGRKIKELEIKSYNLCTKNVQYASFWIKIVILHPSMLLINNKLSLA